MQKEEFVKTYCQFIIRPFKGKGEVSRLNGNGKEFTDSNGYRFIKDAQGNKHPVSHLIWAVGCSLYYKNIKSYAYMKNFTIRYKDGDKSNCHYDNLICIPKKSFINKLKKNKEQAKYWI